MNSCFYISVYLIISDNKCVELTIGLEVVLLIINFRHKMICERTSRLRLQKMRN